jgi:hypothetical protein
LHRHELASIEVRRAFELHRKAHHVAGERFHAPDRARTELGNARAGVHVVDEVRDLDRAVAGSDALAHQELARLLQVFAP